MGLFSINSKMKKSANSEYKKIVNFTLPAFKTKDNITVCPQASLCISTCYAKSGAYLFSNVYNKHRSNLDAAMSNDFINLINQEILKLNPSLIRLHDSGEFFSEEYLQKWLTIMRVNPNTKFYAYTKQVELIKKYQVKGLIPANFTVIFSLGGKQDRTINREVDRHSKVFETIEQLIFSGYANASLDDTVALGINQRIGLVFHSNKNWNKGNWDKVN